MREWTCAACGRVMKIKPVKEGDLWIAIVPSHMMMMMSLRTLPLGRYIVRVKSEAEVRNLAAAREQYEKRSAKRPRPPLWASPSVATTSSTSISTEILSETPPQDRPRPARRPYAPARRERPRDQVDSRQLPLAPLGRGPVEGQGQGRGHVVDRLRRGRHGELQPRTERRVSDHYSLKCQRCFRCIREGEDSRRIGSATITFWTPVGPWTVTLCGDCAYPIVQILEKDGQYNAPLHEKPERSDA